MKAFFKYLCGREIYMRMVVRLFSWYLRCVDLTTRWQVQIDGTIPPDTRFIIACWHGRILMTNVVWRHMGYQGTPIHFIVSPSKDGTVLKYFLRIFGYNPLVGSSGSGTGFAPFKNAIKVLQQNKPFGIAPDGSRGPRYKMKDGVGFLAIKQKAPIILFSFNTSRRKVLNSWDKMVVPKPFSRGVIVIKILDIDTINAIETPTLNDFLQRELNDVTHRSDAYFGHAE